MMGDVPDKSTGETGAGLPDWLPSRIQLYIDHIEHGRSLRALARDRGLNPSTVLRQVRRCEARRDDPLMDGALDALRLRPSARNLTAGTVAAGKSIPDERQLRSEGRRLLQRLAEPGALLAFSPEMEKAVILRELPDGRNARTAVLDRTLAQAFSLKEWIRCRKAGRVSTYEISAAGRAELRRIGAGPHAATGLAEAPAPFAGLHSPVGRGAADDAGSRRGRGPGAETPIAALGRRRDRDGKPFLEPALVRAAEQLREDYELARMAGEAPAGAAPHPAPPDGRAAWSGKAGGRRPDDATRASERLEAALHELGPGLADIALRVCCRLEGVESAEREMGWAARSGKIVLRIALIRLRRHYEASLGGAGPLIG